MLGLVVAAVSVFSRRLRILDRDFIIQALYYYGQKKALELREEAPTLTDTEVIDQEIFIPHWKEGPHTAGDPLQYEGQV